MIYLDKSPIPGFNQVVRLGWQLAGEDISGNSTSTARADNGDKAKELHVGTLIRFVDKVDLVALVAMAEAKNDKDERKIFSIINLSANTVGIKQVRFEGDFSVDEQENLQAWQVSFKLVEYHSVAEKKQQRMTKAKRPKVATQTKSGTQPITPVKSDPNDPNALAAFDKVLKGAESKLAGQ